MEEKKPSNSDEEFKLGGDVNKEENGGDDDDDLPPLVEAISIPELADMVVSHLDEISDLKNFRLVSTLWRDVTLDKWRKTAVFCLTSDASQQALKHTLVVDEGLPSPLPPNFTIYRFHDKPFRQYALEEGHTFPPELPSLENELYFWEKCGPSITYLDLGECFFKKGLYFEGLNWILRSCPNLEELDFAPHKCNIVKDHDIDSDTGEDNSLNQYLEEEEENIIYHIPNKSQNEETLPVRVKELGDKLKSLTFSYSHAYGAIINTSDVLFSSNSKLATAFFGLIPNITTLAIKDMNCCNIITKPLCQHAKDSSEELRPFIQLKKFSIINSSEITSGVILDVSDYLTFNPELKTLQLDCLPLSEVLPVLNQMKRALRAIKEHVEEIDLVLDCNYDDFLIERDDGAFETLKPNSCFDFFSLRFPQLTKLSLIFYYWKNADYGKFLSFDFGMLRGTPNLKHFHFGAQSSSSCFVMEKLGVQDLVKRKEQSWYRVKNIEDDVELEGEEPFLPHEEIILEKMEEFHYEGAFDAEALRFLGQAMKNLKVLEIILDNETFPVPFQVWGGEKLRKVKAYVLSEGGLEDSVIAEQQERYPMVEVSKVELPQQPGWLSLSSKELKAFPMRPIYPSSETSYSDSSTTDGDDNDSDAGSSAENNLDSSNPNPPGSGHRSTTSGSEGESD